MEKLEKRELWINRLRLIGENMRIWFSKEEMADGHAAKCSSSTLTVAVHVHNFIVFTVIFPFHEKNGEAETKNNRITIQANEEAKPP